MINDSITADSTPVKSNPARRVSNPLFTAERALLVACREYPRAELALRKCKVARIDAAIIAKLEKRVTETRDAVRLALENFDAIERGTNASGDDIADALICRSEVRLTLNQGHSPAHRKALRKVS